TKWDSESQEYAMSPELAPPSPPHSIADIGSLCWRESMTAMLRGGRPRASVSGSVSPLLLCQDNEQGCHCWLAQQ
ncbi:MAG: hypothetical protein ACC645_13020, partial [Pirellulales bacterium]